MPLTSLHRFDEDDLNPDEFIIYRAHLSFVAFFIVSIPTIVEIIGSLLFLGLAFWYRHEIGFFDDAAVTFGILIAFGGLLMYGSFRFSVRLIDYIYDEDIITNQRVIDYNQKFLFSRDQSTANMNAITNTILNQSGVLRTLFNYGMLQVQTAASDISGGASDYLMLHDVNRPKQIQRLIDEISHRVKSRTAIVPDEVLKICELT